MPAAEWIGGVDRHQIEITCQAAVLKAVVEHDDVGTRGGGRGGGRDAVTIGDMPDAGEEERQFGCFVAPPSRGGAVPTADDRRTRALSGQPTDHPGHQRRLAGAAEGQIADAHHRHAGGPRGEPSAVVGRVAEGHDRPPRGPERREGETGQRRSGGGVGPVDEALERFCVRQQRHAVDPSVRPARRAHPASVECSVFGSIVVARGCCRGV